MPAPSLLLTNARIVDVENGCYYPASTNLVIRDGRIVALPGLPDQPADLPVEAVIDLHGLAAIWTVQHPLPLTFIPRVMVCSRWPRTWPTVSSAASPTSAYPVL